MLFHHDPQLQPGCLKAFGKRHWPGHQVPGTTGQVKQMRYQPVPGIWSNWSNQIKLMTYVHQVYKNWNESSGIWHSHISLQSLHTYCTSWDGNSRCQPLALRHLCLIWCWEVWGTNAQQLNGVDLTSKTLRWLELQLGKETNWNHIQMVWIRLTSKLWIWGSVGLLSECSVFSSNMTWICAHMERLRSGQCERRRPRKPEHSQWPQYPDHSRADIQCP